MENIENVITYDYKTIKVRREMETIVCDTYQNLGWEQTGSATVEGSIAYVNLSFKRDRKIANKMELLKIQEKVDSTLLSIENAQKQKKNAGTTNGLVTGIAGALIFGGGMSMTMTLTGAGFLAGGIVLGVVGIAVCVSAYFISRKVRNKRLEKIQPVLESEYDKLADLCENAAKLR